MQAELVQVDLFVVVGDHFSEVLHDFARPLATCVVENNVDRLRSDPLEIQLRPNLRLQLLQRFLDYHQLYLVLVDEDVRGNLFEEICLNCAVGNRPIGYLPQMQPALVDGIAH